MIFETINIWNGLFVFTFILTALNIFKLIVLAFGKDISLPGVILLSKTTPDKWWLFYIGFFHQTWWWFNHYGLI
jgi:hypothetical protein